MQTLPEIIENQNRQIVNMARIIGNMEGHAKFGIEQLQRIANTLPKSLQRTELQSLIDYWLNNGEFIEFCWSRRSENLEYEELYNEWQANKLASIKNS